VDTPRGGDSARVEVVSPKGVLAERPDAFVWRAFAGAKTYRVHLFSENGKPIWTSEEVTALSVPLAVSTSLTTGRYYWQVEALSGGDVVATSALVRFSTAR